MKHGKSHSDRHFHRPQSDYFPVALHLPWINMSVFDKLLYLKYPFIKTEPLDHGL